MRDLFGEDHNLEMNIQRLKKLHRITYDEAWDLIKAAEEAAVRFPDCFARDPEADTRGTTERRRCRAPHLPAETTVMATIANTHIVPSAKTRRRGDNLKKQVPRRFVGEAPCKSLHPRGVTGIMSPLF